LFLNDLEEFLLTKDIVGLKSITDLNLKVFCRISSELVLVLHFCQIPRPRNHIREKVLSFYQRDLAGFSLMVNIVTIGK
jgi:hypothetical protein